MDPLEFNELIKTNPEYQKLVKQHRKSNNCWGDTQDKSYIVKHLYLNIVPRDGVLLDIGSGSGMLTDALAKKIKAHKVIFNDIDDFRSDYIKEKYQSDVVTDLKQVPDNSVDVIFASMSLHHISDLSVHENIIRILKPRTGVFILREHGVHSEDKEYQKLLYFHHLCYIIYRNPMTSEIFRKRSMK